MDPQPRGYEWRSVLLLIFNLGSAIVSLSVAAALVAMFVVNKRTLDLSPPMTTVLGATALAMNGVLLLPAAVLSWQRLKGRHFNPVQVKRLSTWGWVTFPLLWILVLALATLLFNAPGAVWYLPLLHFLGVAIPVYLLVRTGLHSIPLGSMQRVWGVFGSGYSLSLLLAILLELVLVAIVVIGFGVFLGLNPGRLAEMEQLAATIEAAQDFESLIPILEPFLNNPLTLLGALGFLSVFVPVVEELAKSIGVWLVVDRLQSPAQGFAMGFLSGAGFALAESLSATLTPDTSWAFAFLTRAVSSCMHMLASGLVGMGIAYLRLERSALKLGGLTCLAILLHASWNAGAVLTVAGGLRLILTMPQVDFPGILFGLAGAGVLFALGAAMLVALVWMNLRLSRLHAAKAGSPDTSTARSPE